MLRASPNRVKQNRLAPRALVEGYRLPHLDWGIGTASRGLPTLALVTAWTANVPSSILLSESWIVIFPESVYLDGDLNPPPAADVSRKFSVAVLVRVARRRDRPRGQQEEAPRA